MLGVSGSTRRATSCLPAPRAVNYRNRIIKGRPSWSRLWLFASSPTKRSTLMDSEKYIGLDVHQATIVVAVMDSTGKLVMESILETEAATILQFFAGLRGTLSVTFEEGTWSAWLYDLLNPHVDKLVVCMLGPQ